MPRISVWRRANGALTVWALWPYPCLSDEDRCAQPYLLADGVSPLNLDVSRDHELFDVDGLCTTPPLKLLTSESLGQGASTAA